MVRQSAWLWQTGLTFLLPHGYQGQGPEHSSARLDCFLQMSDDNSFVIPEMDQTLPRMQSANCECYNPFKLLPVLQHQIHRDFRKPLIAMAEIFAMTEGLHIKSILI